MARITVALLVFGFLSVPPVVHAQTGSGIIGFGISLWPDLCCQACYDSLSALYLNCTTFSDDSSDTDGMDMGSDDDMATASTSDDCRASNTPWLQTMAYCIQSNCDLHGYGAAKQAKCFSVHAVDGASEPTFQESLPPVTPTTELSADAVWLNTTSLVNGDLYYSTYGSEGNFAAAEYYHTRYAMIIHLTTIGIIVVCGVLAQLKGVFPRFQKKLQTSSLWAKLQQHVFLPALFGSRQHEPIAGNVGYVPGRSLSIFIVIYIILNVVLSSVSFKTFTPNVFWNSPQFELCEYVGNRTGTLSLVNLSMSILFAGRNNLLITLTGWSHTTFLILHRWAARVATVQAVVHSIVYTLAYFEPGYDGASAYAAEAAMPFYWWGIIATIAFSLAAGFAMLPIRTRLYEVFLIVHIVLAILALIGCWYHLVPHFGFTYGYQTWLYLCFAFWAFDRTARVARVLYYSRLSGLQATVEHIPNSDIVHLTVFPRVWNFGPGQHSFLYFPSLGWGKGWESHPFSVAAWNSHEQRQPHCLASASSDGGDIHQVNEKSATVETTSKSLPQTVSVVSEDQAEVLPSQTQSSHRPSIEFLIRSHSGMTSWLRDYANSSLRGKAIDLALYTEGPYAGHQATLRPLNNADTILCVVGGIGITHVLSILHEYVAARRQHGELSPTNRSGVMARATRFILAWSVREMALLEHVKERFLASAAEVDGLEYHFWCTDAAGALPKSSAANENGEAQGTPNVTMGRMTVGAVIRSSLERGRLMTVVVCGPGNMADETNREVVQCVKEGFRVDSIQETYQW